MLDKKFEDRMPSHQNAIDIFTDKWASKVESVYPGVMSGIAPMFTEEDQRPRIAARHLGVVPMSLHDMSVLELGPLEAAHTYQLAKLGAKEIIAIESNIEAYIKCLIVKEILNIPRAKFLLGDCIRFMEENEQRFDMVFCSGILYHMEDPFKLIEAISDRTDRVFLWTHYYSDAVSTSPARQAREVERGGIRLKYWEVEYGDMGYGKFWGGNKKTAAWLEKEDIIRCFTHFGFDVTVHDDSMVHPGGPNINATAIRNRKSQMGSV